MQKVHRRMDRMALEELRPQEVFYYFEQLCRIPHGSGNTKRISDYLVSFAGQHQLFCRQDARNNVIIVKEAAAGYEKEPTMILQGHMDMVAVKEEGCLIDLEKEGLTLGVEGDLVYAKGTSLGADDGIFVAYALALLASDKISHPRLEVIFTVDEEVGMEGALFLDVSMLKGKRLLNIDSETQGELTVSCAGGVRVNGRFEDITEQMMIEENESIYQIELCKLTGGHSGTEIHHGRANANIEMGRLLHRLLDALDFRLMSIQGGTKDNVIPDRATAELLVLEGQERLPGLVADAQTEFQNRCKTTDPDLQIKAVPMTLKGVHTVFTTEGTKRFLAFLNGVPNGVQAMSRELPGLVETSLNLGVIQMKEKIPQLAFSIRSSRKSAKDELRERLQYGLQSAGAVVSLSGDYPAWELNPDSKLVVQMQTLYEEMFGEKPVVLSVHAGLECGILADKIKGLDSVSFGPDIYDIHTTRERLSVSSTEQMWKFLVKLLEQKTVITDC